MLSGYVWTLKQNESDIFYRVYESVVVKNKRILKEVRKCSDHSVSCYSAEKMHQSDIYEYILRDYFQLGVETESLYDEWRAKDPHFVKVSESMQGVRVLRQDPVETLFAFICSSNNNIPRISGMVVKLCHEYGENLGEIDGVSYYSFPDMKDLKGPRVEQHLRSIGFGYRAKFISQCASYILEHYDSKWLENLRSVPYNEAHEALCRLPGVGAKVADCVCLMSLDKHDAVPVDTHVWQITTKHYLPQLTRTKSLTTKVYKEIGDHYRELFGKYAGWAQSVLFAADLKRFQDTQSTILENSNSKSAKRSVESDVPSISSSKPPSKKKKKNRK